MVDLIRFSGFCACQDQNIAASTIKDFPLSFAHLTDPLASSATEKPDKSSSSILLVVYTILVILSLILRVYLLSWLDGDNVCSLRHAINNRQISYSPELESELASSCANDSLHNALSVAACHEHTFHYG